MLGLFLRLTFSTSITHDLQMTHTRYNPLFQSIHFFVVVGLQAAYIHSPFAGILTAARIWPSHSITLFGLFGRKEWNGTATELLEELNQIVGEKASKYRYWPKTASVLSRRIEKKILILNLFRRIPIYLHKLDLIFSYILMNA